MTEAMARELVMANTGQVLNDAHLAETSKRAIIVRMLHNLAGVAEREQDLLAVLRYFDTIILLDPEAPYARWRRGVLNLQTGQSAAARADFDWLLEHKPDGINLDEVRQLRNLLGTD
jgi:regulator of sirC expression with transglutaminase-like and TPR domain